MKNENRVMHPRKEHAQTRSGRCIALIDSNYMAWLLKQGTDSDAEPEAYNRQALIPSLVQTLKQNLNLRVGCGFSTARSD